MRRFAARGVGALLPSAAVVMLAVALRLTVAGDVAFSPADEARYLAMATAVHDGGLAAFPRLVAETLASQELQLFPTPLRYGYVILAALAGKVAGAVTFGALAGLSCAAGMVTVVLTAILGTRTAGPRAGALAGFFLACSPLALALGRRALQDTVVTALATLLVLLASELFRAPHHPRSRASGLAVAAALTAAALVAAKETSVLLVWALAIDAVVRARADRRLLVRALPFVLGPPIAVLGFLAVAGSADDFARLLAVAAQSAEGAYVRAFMAGPPQRVLVDLVTLAPIVSVLAVVGLTRPRESALSAEAGTRIVESFLVAGLVAAACLPKNVRFTAALEPALCVVGATGLVHLVDRLRAPRRPYATALVVAAVAASAWHVFTRVFVEHRVYDPTTLDLLSALDAIPHAGPMRPGTTSPVLALALVAAVVVALASSADVESSER